MSLYDNYIKKLKEGIIVTFRPKGNSMSGRIESGQLVTIIPNKNLNLEINDIVLCKVKGRIYLHLIKAKKEDRYLIGNNKNHLNGWISLESIFGKCIRVEK